MRVQQQPAYLIHHYDYSESSLLLELLTRDYGRVGVIAKGARRPRSGKRALLNLFSPLLVSWSGRGELGVVTDIEANGLPLVLVGDVLYSGFYINELMLRLLHRDDAHSALFDGYHQCLRHLQSNPEHDAALRIFEALVLREIGYGLVLDHDTDSNSVIREEYLYEYTADDGPRRLQPGEIVEHGVEISGTSLIALAQGKVDGVKILRELKTLMRFLLKRHLGDRPLNSRKLINSIKQHTRIESGELQS